jgi:membrane protein
LLVIILAFILILSLLLIVSFTGILTFLKEKGILESQMIYYLAIFGKWIVVVFMLFFAISFMYFLAPARKTRFRFISAGSTLTTLLFIATSLGFKYYVNNFATYNAVYGSIGTFIVIMMWLYLNAIVLIIGYELNASIANAGMQKN